MVKIEKNAGIFFGVLVIAGFGIVAFALLETPFPDLIPLSVILQRECRFNTVGFGEISFGDVECFQNFNRFTTDNLPFQFVLPLSGADLNSPIDLEFDFDPTIFPPECASFVTPNIELILTDGTGSIIHRATEGMVVDIRQFLLPDQQTLIINFDDRGIGICPTSSVLYTEVISSGVRFQQRPPEIREDTNLLLEQWLFLADFRDQQVEESSQRFAIAESFQLVDPTVITDLRVRLGSALTTRSTPVANDFSATVTAFVWNLSETPPKRVVQSAETFTGITESRAELDLDFTFPNAVALLAIENNQPITYAVGIRVDQNIGQVFAYTQSNQTTNTHVCVIDRSSTANAETMFTPNGICGFDIRHDPFKAFQILQALPDPNAPVIPDPLTQAELIALLCEGLEPEPEICQGINTARPTADQCGITEIFFEEQCLCAPTYDRNAQGDCVIPNTFNLPDLLQISQFSFELFLLLGIIIAIIGIAGIIIRRRR